MVIPDSVKVIGDGVNAIFQSGVESVFIPAGVTEIAANAFNYASGLTSVLFAPGSQLKTIGDKAFYLASGIQNLVIPEGVTSIGAQAFVNMHALESITLPSTLTSCGNPDEWFGLMFLVNTSGNPSQNLKAVNIAPGGNLYSSHDGVVYSGDGKTLLFCPAAKTTLEWNDTVETISSHAFYKSNLPDARIPDPVSVIENKAFSSAKLTSLAVPSSVETIGNSAFYNSKLKTVTFEEGLQTIGTSAFGEVYFPSGTTIEIPASVTSVASDAFGCLGDNGPATLKVLGAETELSNSSIPYYNHITVMAPAGSKAQAFVEQLTADKGEKSKVTFEELSDAPVLSDFTISSDGVLTAYTGSNPAVTIPSSVKVIGDGSNAVFGSSVESVTIPAGVTEIAANAFNYASGLTSVTFAPGSQLKTIGDKAFYLASGIQNLVIPEGVTSIGAQAFVNMHALESITLPSTLTSCGNPDEWLGLMFQINETGAAPQSLTAVNVADGCTIMSSYDGAVYSADGSTLLYCPGSKPTITFRPGISAIGERAFYKTSMQTMTIPETVTAIGDNAFNRAGITSLTIPGNVKSIGKSAFFFSKLANLVLEEGVETISDSAFSQSQVSAVTIPASMKSIGQNAFDFEYGSDYYIRLLGSNTVLADEFIPYYYNIKVYGLPGSTAEAYVTSKKAEKGESCKLTFHTEGYTAVTGIALDQHTVNMRRKSTLQLRASIEPETAAGSIAWSSSNPSVVSVDAAGKLTAGLPGTAVITAAIGDFSDSCTVHVVVEEGESDFLVNQSGEITGYLGHDWTTLNIPAEVNGVAVTGIAEHAFQGQTGIHSVILPETVSTIGSHAFAGCSNLERIDLSHVTELGASAFSSCGHIESLVLAEGLEAIPDYAFQGCLSLASITLPSTLKTIGMESFVSCKQLTALELPEGLHTIGKGALRMVPLSTLHIPSTLKNMGGEYIGDMFEVPGLNPADTTMQSITVAEENPWYSAEDGLLYNKDKTQVVFCPRGRTTAVVKDGVDTIAPYAFFMCFPLETVSLPDTLKIVGEHAFQYDEGLITCHLPDGLERIENSGFFGCENWTGVDHIPDTVSYIGAYGFAECLGSSVVIPEGITSVEEFSFWGYEAGLKEIKLPSTLRTIADSAFGWAKDVEELVIPEGVTSIGSQAFARTDGLKRLTLPSTLETIGSGAFLGPETGNQLLEVQIPSSVTTIGEQAFSHRDGLTIVTDSLESAAAQYGQKNGIPVRLETGEAVDPDFEIEHGVLLAYHGDDAQVVIPDSVTAIGNGAFMEEHEGSEGVELKKVTIPASVSSIGDQAFYGTALEEVIFQPESKLKTIGKEAFAYCTKLPAITLPDSLEWIGDSAFSGDGFLESINIPASVESIGNQAFEICGALTHVEFAPNSHLKTIGSKAFYQCIHLEELDIPEGVTSIGDLAFKISTGFQRLYLPSTLTQLGTTPANAFTDPKSINSTGCDELISITVAPENQVYSSHDGVLYSADGKTVLYCPSGKTGTVTVQEGAEVIAPNAFLRSHAAHVELPDSLKTIENRAFINCGLVSVEIPHQVEVIGPSAFYFCQKLKTVQLGSRVRSIGQSAFGESYVNGVTLPASVQTVSSDAFGSLRGWVRVENPDTELTSGWISGYSDITVYGQPGSTAELFCQAQKELLQDKCKLTFQPLTAFVPVRSITVPQETISLKQKQTYQLNPQISPDNATHTELVYKSLDSSKAEVSTTGLITALQPGQATIQILSSDGACCDITVNVERDESISEFHIDDRGFITGYIGQERDLVIPETVQGKTVIGIGEKAFQNSRVIRTVTLPDTVTEIGDEAFQGCKDLREIHFGSGLKTIGDRAFENCSYLAEVHLPDGLEALGVSAFENCERLTSATIPSSLKVIPERAFITCWRLKAITLPEGVETIGKDAFYECEGMETLTLPTSLRAISEGAFAACVRLKEVTIPEGVTSIDRYAFMSCTALTSLHLPSTLETLGREYPGDVFEMDASVLGCSALTEVTVAPGSRFFSAENGLLYTADGSSMLFCPRGRTAAAVAAGTEHLGPYSFFFCRKLESVSLPSTLRTVGEAAFFVCDGLESLTIPEGVTTLGKLALADCTSLSFLSLPETLRTIGERALMSTGLAELSIPAGVTALGNAALAHNDHLTKVTIPSTVTSIGEHVLEESKQVTIYTESSSAPIYAYATALGIPVKLIDSGASHAGGGSSSHSAADRETVTHQDGSTTTTETRPDGTVIETTKAVDGSETVITSRKDGSAEITVTRADGSHSTAKKSKDGPLSAEVELSAQAVREALEGGKPVVLPLEPVHPGASIHIRTNSSEAIRIVIPVQNAAPGTVAVLVHADGTEQIIRQSGINDVGVTLTAADGASIRVIDNSKHFSDIPSSHWAAEDIAFVSSRELFNGTSEGIFSPNSPMTRGQLMTVLARLAGADTSRDPIRQGVDWAVSNGISDGTRPNSSMTRQQLAAMLWRYAGSPSCDLALNSPDAAEIADYAHTAMAWAVENGILNGYEDGTLKPQTTASRAHVAAMIARFVNR